MSVTLRDVFLAVSYGDASLVGESAGYLILGAADAALRTHEQGSLDSIVIDEEGGVRLRGPKVDEDDAERALRQILATLLKKVRIPSNNLERVSQRREPRGLQGLVAELEAALVPVNRRAARRTLARLCREAKKSAARQHAGAEVEEIEPRSAAPAPEPVPVDANPASVNRADPPLSTASATVQPASAHQPARPVPSAPSPVPASVTSVSRAEQTVSDATRRPSQLKTVPAKPERHLLDALAGAFGSQTPVEASPPVEDLPPHQEFYGAPALEPSPPLGDHDFDVDVDDAFDDAPTQVFAGVAPVPQSPARTSVAMAVAAQPAPQTQRRRRHAVLPRRRRQIADDDSLIVMSESAPRRAKSDISDLLDKMSVSPMSTDNLYQGLKTLSRVELSPLAPPVGQGWTDDSER